MVSNKSPNPNTASLGASLGNLWTASVEEGQERRLTDFAGKPGRLGPYAIDTDGDYVYFTWRNDVGDIWVMDVVE